MQVVTRKLGTFLPNRERLESRAQLKDAKQPGVYNLCRHGEKWELYYTASGTSQPLSVTDQRLAEAKQALLNWHRTGQNCDQCVESAPGLWDDCPESQSLQEIEGFEI